MLERTDIGTQGGTCLKGKQDAESRKRQWDSCGQETQQIPVLMTSGHSVHKEEVELSCPCLEVLQTMGGKAAQLEA